MIVKVQLDLTDEYHLLQGFAIMFLKSMTINQDRTQLHLE